MKKKRGAVFGILFLVIILVITSLSLVSASWFGDFWGKITGHAVSNTDLVSDYKFDGDAKDSQGRNPGTLKNGAYFTQAGKFNQGAGFDGTNDYISVPDSLSLKITGKLTLTAWVRETGRKQYAKIASKRIGGDFYFLGLDNGKPYGGIGNGANQSTVGQIFDLPLNEWHHLAFVYDDSANTMKLYYDGVLKQTTNTPYSLRAFNANLSIGADEQGKTYFFTGAIDELRIYSKVLSDVEIKELYEEVPPSPPSCSDSDNGKNYTLKGTTTGLNISGVYVEKIDSCSGNNLLNEFFCENNIVKYAPYTCPDGCSGGVCVSQNVTTCTNDCTSGNVEKSCLNSTRTQNRTCGNYDTDSCLDWSSWTYTNCASGQICQNSICISQNATNVTCTDSDYGLNYFIKGTTNGKQDVCENSMLTEWYCKSNGVIATQQIDCQFGCKDGACVAYDGSIFPQFLENYYLWSIRDAGAGGCENLEDHPDTRELGLIGEICSESKQAEYRDSKSDNVVFVILMDITKGISLYNQYLTLVTKPAIIGKVHVLRLENHELLWKINTVFDLILTQEGKITSHGDGWSYSYGTATGNNSVTSYFLNKFPPSEWSSESPEIDKCPELSFTVRAKIKELQGAGQTISLKEGEKVYRSQYLVVDDDNGGKVLKVHTIANSTVGYDNDQVTLTNIINGDVHTATLTSEGTGTIAISGKVFDVKYYGASSASTDTRYLILSAYPLDEIDTFYCNETTFETCPELLEKAKNPKDFEEGGIRWLKGNNYAWDWSFYLNGKQLTGREYYSYYSNYNPSDVNYQYNSLSYSIVVADDKEANLNEALKEYTSNMLCTIRSFYSDGEENRAYVCRWDILNDEADTNNGYENKNREVLWAQKNILVRIYSYTGSKLTDEEVVKISQKRVNDFLNSLKDNQNKYGSWQDFNVDYPMTAVIEKDLKGCPSEILNEEEGPCWSCKIEPVICPEYGYQKKTCIDSCGVKEEKEEQIYCSPGVCSGCIIPRWFKGNDNICMPYGFRFDYQTGILTKLVEFTEEDRVNQQTGESHDVTLEVLSSEKAVLTLYGKETNYSYILTPDADVEVILPDWEDKIQEIFLHVNKIYFVEEGSKENYVDLKIKGSRYETIPETINAYCDVDGIVKQQKIKENDGNWAKCQNNYECESNFCSSGECIEIQQMLNQASGLKKMFYQIFCKIIHPIDADNYEQCLVGYLGTPAPTSSGSGGGGSAA